MNWLVPQRVLVHDWYTGVIPSQVQDFVFTFAELYDVPLCPLSRLSSSLWMVSQLCGVSTIPPSFISSANFMRACSIDAVLLVRPLMKISSSISPNMDPWCTLIVTGFRLNSVPLITTFWTWQFSHLPLHFSVYLSRPYFHGLSLRILLKTVSKTLLKLR